MELSILEHSKRRIATLVDHSDNFVINSNELIFSKTKLFMVSIDNAKAQNHRERGMASIQ